MTEKFKRTFSAIRQCRSCGKGYRFIRGIRESFLCDACCDVCEEAMKKLIDYFKDNPKAPPIRITDNERIVEITEAPPVMVWVLDQEGKLLNIIKPTCTRCQRDLEEDDKDVCKPCIAMIAHSLESALTARSEMIIKEAQRSYNKHQYGLNSRDED